MKRLAKDILGFTRTGITMGVGTTVIGKAGGSTAGMTELSGFMPMMGTLSGAGAVFRQAKRLKHI